MNTFPQHSETKSTIPSCLRNPCRPAVWVALLTGLTFLWSGAPAARAQGTPVGCVGSAIGISLFSSSADVHVGDTLFYSASIYNGIVGNPTSCDASNIVASVTTPDGVVHPITLTRTYLSHAQSDFYNNVASYVVRAQDIRPDGTVRATALVTAKILQNDVPSDGGAAQGVNTQVVTPCIRIVVQCVGSVGENGAITFSGTVTNCGNNTLFNVTVTNNVNGGQFPVTLATNRLARGETVSFSGSWIPIDPCGPSTATFVTRGTDLLTFTPQTVTSSASATCQNTLTPAIKVTVNCSTTPAIPGGSLFWSGIVSNAGNVTLTNVVVVNTQPAPNTIVYTRATLAPGENFSFGASYPAPTNCSVANTLTATAASRCGGGVSSVASVTCPILTTPQITVAVSCPTAPVTPGGSMVHNGTVRNVGDTTLNNIVVVRDFPVPNTTVFTLGSLAPGASANFTSTLTVPANACFVSTTFSGRGTDVCAPNTVTNSASITCQITTAPAIVVTLACPTTPAVTGGPITYTGTVRNSGNVTLNNVTVVNNQSVPSTVFTVASLAPGVSANFTASFTAPADACSVSSTVTASGTDNCTGAVVNHSASATCALTTSPAIRVTVNCSTTPAIPGGSLFWSGIISNAGNVTVTNVVVVHDHPAPNTIVYTRATLAPGENFSFGGSYTAPTNCSVANTLNATATSRCGTGVSSVSSVTCPILTTPRIAVTVSCPTAPVTPGGSMVHSGTVRNIGDITLNNIIVVRDFPVPNTTVFTLGSLAPGASANFTSTLTVPANACFVSTTFSGRGTDACAPNTTVTNNASITCQITTAPAITVTLACPGTSVATGGLITYTGTVRNSGNVILNNVTVVNNQSVPGTVLIVASLAPGVSTNFTASFTAPADACSVSSTVTASGSDNCNGTVVNHSASATCNLVTTPRIVVTQTCPANPASPGGLLTYSGSVSNAGNITLTNIVITNDRTGTTPVFSVATLAPGAILGFTGSYTVPTNSGCTVSSTLTAGGSDKCTGVRVTSTASATCTLLTSPRIIVRQTCPANLVSPGGILTYSGTVSNAGNITLTNVVVVNDKPASNTVIFTVATLAPGAIANFNGSYQVPTNCCVVSSTVIAVGRDICTGASVGDTFTATCTVLTTPKIVVTKVCPPTATRIGDVLQYSGTISNAGNITLVNVTVVNNTPAAGSPVWGPITLAPGESVAYYASYVVPPDFCGDIVTAQGLDACTFAPVTHSVTTTCPVITTSRIAVIKHCPQSPTPRGGLFTFTGSVSNAGNTALINVFVVNSQPSNNTPVIGPITLAPGATANFSGSYMAPSCCCYLVDTLTARGQDRCSGTNVTATSTAICPLATTPGITVTRICPSTTVPVGALFTYSGSVSNTGDVVLTNVFVVSSQPSPNTPLLGPIELAPRETKTFSGSYTVTANSNPAADTVTARGTDTCQGRTVTATANCVGLAGLPGAPTITSVTHNSGVVTVTWTATPGAVYTLQGKTNLNDANWINVPGTVTKNGDTASQNDTIGSNQQRFYRVMVGQ